ncbi:MAG: hypothetical protein PVF54_08105, partial [Anaerolineae bacterium]
MGTARKAGQGIKKLESRGEALKRCSMCILPASYPRIVFDDEGICNYCGANTESSNRGSEDELQRVLARFRQGGKYDCIVALSGGRDSSYVAYYAVKELALNVLAVTCDNGFMPQQTRTNITRTVRRLGIDHVYLNYDYVKDHARQFISSWIRNPSPALIAFLCSGCMTGIRECLTEAAYSYDVSVILGGGGGVVGLGGEPEQSFAEKLLSVSSGDGRIARPLGMLAGFLIQLAKNPSYFQSACLASFGREFLNRFWYGYNKDLEVLGLFEFVEWNEDEVVNTIRDVLKWEKPAYRQTTWRADCKIHFLKDYLYGETLGFTKNVELLSGMIREGMITRKKALERLKDDDYLSRQFLEEFLLELGIELQDLCAAMAR